MIRRALQLVVSVVVGVLAFRAGFATLRDQGASAWALALMLCVIAGASWTLALASLRPAPRVGVDVAGHEAADDTRKAETGEEKGA